MRFYTRDDIIVTNRELEGKNVTRACIAASRIKDTEAVVRI